MLSVVIVEDEPKVSLLIQGLIQWDELGMQLLGVADNGREAWDLIQAKNPAIVITDIRMPEMNGLELIERSRSEGLKTSFVIISGYRHFDYAHQAIKYGVEDYLLKPINQKELNETLRKIARHISQTVEADQTQPPFPREVAGSRVVFPRELIERVIEGARDVANLDIVNRTYGLQFRAGWFQAIAIKLDNRNPETVELATQSLITEKAIEIAAAELGPWTLERVIVARKLGLIVGVLNLTEEHRTTVNKVYNHLLSLLQDYVFAHKDYEVTLAIGRGVDHFDQLGESVLTAMEALPWRIVLGVGRKYVHDDHRFQAKATNAQVLLRLQTTIGRTVESFDSTRLKEDIGGAFQELVETPDVAPRRYYELAEDVIRIFFDHRLAIDTNQAQKDKTQLVQQVEDQYTVATLIGLLQDKLGALLEADREQQIAQVKKPVREAKRYLDEHFAEKVSLDDLARIVNFNPVYFSVVFKKETGRNVGDYVLQLRIEAAKSLLRETNLTVMAIAQKVGYEDAKYFSQLFTREVGINPGVYRKLYA